MANIKFSQFTVGNTESDIDFVVGYKGANNIQISPANLLSATLSGYLPLTGGTMTGTSGIHMPDNFALKAGNSQDLEIFHNGTDSSIRNFEGNLIIRNADADKDVIFQADDGAGGIATYFYLDGSLTTVTPRTVFPDNSVLSFGTGADLQIYHSGTDSVIDNLTGDLYISNKADNKDIIFRSDDGGGGFTEYFRVDGGNEHVVYSKSVIISDNLSLKFGDSTDLVIQHNQSASLNQIDNNNFDLYIQQNAADKDIIFRCDDGSGGLETYFFLDGSQATGGTVFTKFPDQSVISLGDGSDAYIRHDGTNTRFDNFTGNLKFKNTQDDGDIIFESDDGSGGTTEYFTIDGGLVANIFYKRIKLIDNVQLQIGSNPDLVLFHDASNSYIQASGAGDLIIEQRNDDQDIVFNCDDGSGGVTEYFKLDGSLADGNYTYTTRPDGGVATFGDQLDLRIWRDPIINDSYIRNYSDDLIIESVADDKDILFRCDDGSGGVTTYFFLDGSATRTVFEKEARFLDNVKANFGSSEDFQISHNGSNTDINNFTGNLNILNAADDGDIIFYSDDGSGGNAEYFKLDGSDTNVRFSKDIKLSDGVLAMFGSNNDLLIYHDGSNSYVDQVGTGDLIIRTSGTGDDVFIRALDDIFIQPKNGEAGISVLSDGEVALYHNNVKKLDTRTTGIRIAGVSEYADNTAAIAAGLTTGDVYRTGDLLKIVH